MRHERIGSDVALVVDLDHTLVTADLAMEAMLRVTRTSARAFFVLVWVMLKGRAALKCHLARVAPVDAAALPYRSEVLVLIAEARAARRPVILATAAHWRNAARVARHLGLFDAVIASSARANLKGSAKLAGIRGALGTTAFDYVGDAGADRVIWRESRVAYTVAAATGCAEEERLARRRPLARVLLRAARPQQWAKNALVFVPLATSGMLIDGAALLRAGLAFACLSVIASGVYLLNDLVDIDADRLHAKKCRRPLAAGDLSIPVALLAAVLFMGGGLAASFAAIGPRCFAVMAVYCAMTLAYSFRLKSAMIADVMMLACLYTIRIIAGSAAIGVATSSWLLLFSLFFFLSLGYLKRYIELSGSAREMHELLSGRGYIRSDSDVVAISGIGAGMVSILVMVLFAEAMGRTGSYATPAALWLVPLPLLYWLNRIWMMGARGLVDSDPVAFAVTDRKSLVLGMVVAAIIMVAKYAPLAGLMGRFAVI